MREAADADLVRRHLGGDADAFAELVRRHEARVYRIALRMTGRPEDARDATQEAFLSALRKLRSFRGDAAFTTWLHRVAVNACYDLLRRRARTPLAAEEGLALLDDVAAPGADPAERTAAAIDVRRALLEVPEEHRAVLLLHDVEDLGFPEISEALGIPVGTVKSRLHRGRVALARALGEPTGADGASNP
ncbi:MAG: RNA polymerase sigma factor [Actinomycetota bacterium]